MSTTPRTTHATPTPDPAQAVDERFEVLVPRPRRIEPAGRTLSLTIDGASRPISVVTDPELPNAEWLTEYLSQFPGVDLPAATADPHGVDLTIRLSTAGHFEGVDGPEAYRLAITTDGIKVTGADAAGLFWGLQTLRQLLPPSNETNSGDITLPTGTITDAPRFAWRGLMLDVARHFFGADDVIRVLDAMALYKMNRLHLHLSDDQGWRLAIDGYPELTEIGGATQVGDGPGGYYSQDDYRRIVAHAEARHVMVVPEIDLPGHTNAALSSVPELNCDGTATAPYRGVDVGFSSLCVGTPETDRFVETVLTQVARLTPGPYLHIGGDEATSTDRAAYNTFIEATDAKVRELGKITVGWEDFVTADLHPTAVTQVWRDERADRIAEQNLAIVASPAAHTYLDQQYDEEMEFGFTWAGAIDTRRAYKWDPTQLGGDTELGAVPDGADPTRSTPEERILGVEGPVWTETVERFDQLCQLLFPRAAALAEVGWTDRERRDWDGFKARFATHPERLAALGIAVYADPALGA